MKSIKIVKHIKYLVALMTFGSLVSGAFSERQEDDNDQPETGVEEGYPEFWDNTDIFGQNNSDLEEPEEEEGERGCLKV